MEEAVQAEETAAKLLRGPQDTTALVGDRVLLKTTYTGRPEPTVKWSKVSRELKNDERTSITSCDGVSCLLLQNITADDSGKYDVSVKNEHGEDSSYASLAVEGPPDPPSGTPSITASLDSITVAWSSSPYDGGKIVNGYTVEYSMVGSDIWTTAVDKWHSLSYIVHGLQPGGRYVFRVRAFNIHGYSKPSVDSDIVQLEEHDESTLFEPRIVSVEPGSEFKIRYEVLEELGKGRFGVVHKVVDKESNQKFAAKFIKCRTSKDRDKVQDEIDIMNLLRHQKLLQLAAAFENPRDMIMVMEYISGGELFERVVADDFTLTEKDCILFMRQICEGVAYMHSQTIVHLDLKPENIMCHTRTSHEIKIIDFGLAHKLNPKEPIRVLFGTPEFISPEIISYEPIGIESDMWSLGVICYVLLSGLSPFMGDNDSETFTNITKADYDFEDEAFSTVSQNARDFIGALLIKRKEDRLSAEQCLKHVWLDPETHQETVVLCTDKLKKFIIRRKWQKTGNAIRAIGRMTSLGASRRNSANSSPNTPRPSISGTSIPRMSSVNEEDSLRASTIIFNTSNDVEQDERDPLILEPDVSVTFTAVLPLNESTKISIVEDNVETTKDTLQLESNGLPKTKTIVKQANVDEEDHTLYDPNDNEVDIELNEIDLNQETIKNSDTFEIECQHKNIIEKELIDNKIDLEIQQRYEMITKRLNELENNQKTTPTIANLYKKSPNRENNVVEATYETKLNRFKKLQDIDIISHQNNGKILTDGQYPEIINTPLKTSKEHKKSKSIRSRACSERSDSGFSDCSTLVTSTSSTPLLGKKFCINEESEEKTYGSSTTLYLNNYKNNLTSRNKENIDNKEETDANNGIIKPKLSDKIDKFTKGRPPASSSSVKKIPIYTHRTVAGTIKKFDMPSTNSTKTENNMVTINTTNAAVAKGVTTKNNHSSRVENIVRKLSNHDLRDGTNLTAAPPCIRYRSPSPSLLRKTQAVIAKEQNNEYYITKQALMASQKQTDQNFSISKLGISQSNKKDKPKSESFRKAAAFWNSPKT